MKAGKRLMKSEKEVEKICRDLMNKASEEYLTENYPKIVYGTIGVCMTVLNKQFGFGRKRLQKLKDEIEAEYVTMNAGICGRKYTSEDCLRYLKENYGIDFDESHYGEGWKDECNYR